MIFGDYPKYKGLCIVPAQSSKGGKNVLDEMARVGIDLDDVAEILEKGYESHRKRKKDIVEKYFDRGDKTIEVVVMKSNVFEEDVWEVIHVGMFTKKLR